MNSVFQKTYFVERLPFQGREGQGMRKKNNVLLWLKKIMEWEMTIKVKTPKEKCLDIGFNTFQNAINEMIRPNRSTYIFSATNPFVCSEIYSLANE